MKLFRGLSASTLALALAACAGANINDHVQFYDGDAQADVNTALIKGGSLHHDGSHGDPVRIIAVNDKPLPNVADGSGEGADAVSVLPGVYSVKVLYRGADPQAGVNTYDTLRINAHAGCKYRVVAYVARAGQAVVFDVLPSAHGAADPTQCVGMGPPPAP